MAESGSSSDKTDRERVDAGEILLIVSVTLLQTLLSYASLKVKDHGDAMVRLARSAKVTLLALVLMIVEVVIIVVSFKKGLGGVATGAVILMGQSLSELVKHGQTVWFAVRKAHIFSGAALQFIAGLSPLLSNTWGIKAVLAEFSATNVSLKVPGPVRSSSRVLGWDVFAEAGKLVFDLLRLVAFEIPVVMFLVFSDSFRSLNRDSGWDLMLPFKALSRLKRRYDRRRRIWRVSASHPSKLRLNHLPSTTWIIERSRGEECEETLDRQIALNVMLDTIGSHVPSWQLSGVTVKTPTWLAIESYAEDYWGMVWREVVEMESFIESLKSGTEDWAALNKDGRDWDIEDTSQVSDAEAKLVWKELQVRHDIKSVIERVTNFLRFLNPMAFLIGKAVHASPQNTGGQWALSLSHRMFQHIMEQMVKTESDPKYTSEFTWLNVMSLIAIRLHMRSAVGSGIIREEMLSEEGKRLYSAWVREVKDRPTTNRILRTIITMKSFLAGSPEWKEGAGDELSNISLEWWGRRALQIEKEGLSGILEQLVVEVAIETIADSLEAGVYRQSNTRALVTMDSGPVLALQMKQAYSLLYLNMDLPSVLNPIDLTLVLYHVLFLVAHMGDRFNEPNAITNRTPSIGGEGGDVGDVNEFGNEARNWLHVPCPIPLWTESPGEWRPWRLYRSPIEEIAAIYKIPNPGIISFWQPYKYPGMDIDVLLELRQSVENRTAATSGQATVMKSNSSISRGRHDVENPDGNEEAKNVKMLDDILTEMHKLRFNSDLIRLKVGGIPGGQVTMPASTPATKKNYPTAADMAYEIGSNSVMERRVRATKKARKGKRTTLLVPSQKELNDLKNYSLVPRHEEWKERSLRESLVKLCEVGQGNPAIGMADPEESIKKMLEFVGMSGASIYLIAESIVGYFLELADGAAWNRGSSTQGDYKIMNQVVLRVSNCRAVRELGRSLTSRNEPTSQETKAMVASIVHQQARSLSLTEVMRGFRYQCEPDTSMVQVGTWKMKNWKYE